MRLRRLISSCFTPQRRKYPSLTPQDFGTRLSNVFHMTGPPRGSLLLVLVVLSSLILVAPQTPSSAWQCYEGEATCSPSPCTEDPLGCYPESPQPPPPACIPSCMPPGEIPVILSGRVLDADASPVSGASVYWTYGMVATSSDGSYSITVWANKPVLLYAAKAPTFTWNSLNIPDPASAVINQNNLTLSYLHYSSVAPNAFNTLPQNLTYTVVTSAPLTGALGPNRFLLHTPQGDVLTLTQDLTYSNPGWTRWTATQTAASSLSDGKYTFVSCTLSAGSPGDCGDPGTGGVVLSYAEKPGQRPIWVVDRVAPSVKSTFPGRFADHFALSNVTATWRDPLAGITPPRSP